MTGATSEDRLALEDLLSAYCAAIDARGDAGAAANFYTDDGVMDNTALGAPLFEGRAALIEAITGMFAAMSSLEHYLGNFLVLELGADVARTQADVQAFGTPQGGAPFTSRGVYQMDARRDDGGWKIARLVFRPAG